MLDVGIWSSGPWSLPMRPRTLLLALLPAETAFAWSALFHLSVAGLGMFLLLETLGLRRPACLTGAAAFAFGIASFGRSIPPASGVPRRS